jgi:hypothetical protein
VTGDAPRTDEEDKGANTQRAKHIEVAEQYLAETAPSLSADLRHEMALDAIYSPASYREVDTPFGSSLLERVHDFEWLELTQDFAQFHASNRGRRDWYEATTLAPARVSKLAKPGDTSLRFWLEHVVSFNQLLGWLKQAYPESNRRTKDRAVWVLTRDPLLPEVESAYATWVHVQRTTFRLTRFLEAESTSRAHLKQLCNQLRARLDAFDVLQQCVVQRRAFQNSLMAEMNEPRGGIQVPTEDLATDLLYSLEKLDSPSRPDSVGADAYPKLLHALAIAKVQVKSSGRWRESIEVFNPVALAGRTCDLCARRHQYVSKRDIADVKDAPPYHPLCQCSLSGAVPEFLRGEDDSRYFSRIPEFPHEGRFWRNARRFVRGLPVDFDLQWLRSRLRHDFQSFAWPIKGVYE